MLGLGTGLAISVVARAVETSRLAFGPFAFYGNGALIVPALGAGLAIYALWAWSLHSGRPQRALLWSALGLALGVGAVAIPSIPGVLFNGLLFVLPTAAVSYGVYRTLGRGGSPGPAVRTGIVFAGLVLSLPLSVLAVGLIVGPFLSTAAGASGRSVALLGALLTLVLLAGGIGVPLLLIR